MKELRRAGFQVRAVWAAGRKSAERIKRELNIECCTTDIKELVIRADVDLGKYFIAKDPWTGPLAGMQINRIFKNKNLEKSSRKFAPIK